MNKPVQVLEPSSHFSPDPPAVVNRGPREEGGSSFSRILSRSEGESSGAEDGQSLHPSGKKLPEQQVGVTKQQDIAGLFPAMPDQADAYGKPGMPDEFLPAAAIDLPDEPAVRRSLQQAPVPDVSVTEETGFVTAPGIAERLLNTDESALVTTTGQPLQGQVKDIRMLAMASPGTPAVSKEQLQQPVVHDIGGPRSIPASNPVTAETVRIAPDSEPVSNAVREAVQFAIANQASSGNLKQFMQQNGNNPTTSHILPAGNTAEAAAVPFLQALSDTAMTMPAARVSVPVGQPGWGEAVGQQLTWFVSQKISAASLRLNPQHLGPMEMAVSMDGDQASVTFTSPQSVVREALESSIPRLREMLAENGLNLANVNVSQQGKSHREGQGAYGSRPGLAAGNNDRADNDAIAGSDVRPVTVHTQGLVDYYA